MAAIYSFTTADVTHGSTDYCEIWSSGGTIDTNHTDYSSSSDATYSAESPQPDDKDAEVVIALKLWFWTIPPNLDEPVAWRPPYPPARRPARCRDPPG
jgi:hypothetical protein